jgi:hypothetical protein
MIKSEVPSETASERLSDVVPVRRSAEAGPEVGVKAGEAGSELPLETATERLLDARGYCCGARMSEDAASLGNQRRARRLGSGRGDNVAWESKAMAGGGGAFIEG